MLATRFSWTLLAAFSLAWTAAGATDRGAASTPGGKPPAGPAAAADKAKTPASKPASKPACRLCGGTCGLEPICICEPGTKKKSTTSYSMKCEPVCVPAPCLLHGGKHHRRPLSCTDSSCDGTCARATIRTKKSLLKTIREEEVDVMTQKIEYLCRHCSGSGPAAACRSCSSSGVAAPPRHAWWWPWPMLR